MEAKPIQPISSFRKVFNTEQKMYALYGGRFGLMFPIIGTFVECYVQNMGFNCSQLLVCQASTPMLWIIDIAPIVLAVFSSFAGQQMDRVRQTNGGNLKQICQNAKSQTEKQYRKLIQWWHLNSVELHEPYTSDKG